MFCMAQEILKDQLQFKTLKMTNYLSLLVKKGNGASVGEAPGQKIVGRDKAGIENIMECQQQYSLEAEHLKSVDNNILSVHLVCHVDEPLVPGVVAAEVDDVGDDPRGHEGGQGQPVQGVGQGGDAGRGPLRGVKQARVRVMQRELGIVNLAATHGDDDKIPCDCLRLVTYLCTSLQCQSE